MSIVVTQEADGARKCKCAVNKHIREEITAWGVIVANPNHAGSWDISAPQGLKVVIPSNPYDAKGLMTSAIRDVDPVVFCQYSIPASGQEVPDDSYTVPIGQAAVRAEGKDITIIGYAPQTAEIAKAVEQLKQHGISAEFIDPRTLAPLDQVTETIIASVKKTGRLLTSDDGSYSFCNCAEIIARVAEAVPGAKFKRLAFPDAPPPGAPEMINYMRVNATDIVAAAEKMVRG